ncbi:hypothetical protein EIN_508810 [Entamoeba invadens IP1]|uniref:Uncharacterized protein n=1 Tax=Entamoeba invadens IP1 TaxID=370355 RepID=A0A0A1UCJ2_ENTIV|nr:hypothetical protein EIN_508810 [Entamoeba invadens IP1]ELP92880.1 hypothetical protein EIN_508810 [Entamoeba invadens IP1]|eukprot:XP_004259651.1 hypothetical protein EIN_508810 [Entamoeba invadens IP1]
MCSIELDGCNYMNTLGNTISMKLKSCNTNNVNYLDKMIEDDKNCDIDIENIKYDNEAMNCENKEHPTTFEKDNEQTHNCLMDCEISNCFINKNSCDVVLFEYRETESVNTTPIKIEDAFKENANQTQECELKESSITTCTSIITNQNNNETIKSVKSKSLELYEKISKETHRLLTENVCTLEIVKSLVDKFVPPNPITSKETSAALSVRSKIFTLMVGTIENAVGMSQKQTVAVAEIVDVFISLFLDEKNQNILFPRIHISHTTNLKVVTLLGKEDKEEIVQMFKNCVCYGIAIDTTHKNGSEIIGLICRFSFDNFVVAQKKLVLGELFERTTAANITKWVLDALNLFDAPLVKCVFCTSDGCTQMVGWKGGVSTLIGIAKRNLIKEHIENGIKEMASELTLKTYMSHYCFCHRLNVAEVFLWNTADGRVLLAILKVICSDVTITQWNAFWGSKDDYIEHVHIPTMSNTRWCYHELIVDKLINNFKDFDLFFRELDIYKKINTILIDQYKAGLPKCNNVELEKAKSDINYFVFLGRRINYFDVKDTMFLAFAGFYYDILNITKVCCDKMQEKFGLINEEYLRVTELINNLNVKMSDASNGCFDSFYSVNRFLPFKAPIVFSSSCKNIISEFINALNIRFCNSTCVKFKADSKKLSSVKTELGVYQNLDIYLDCFNFPEKYIREDTMFVNNTLDYLEIELTNLKTLIDANIEDVKKFIDTNSKNKICKFSLLDALQLFGHENFLRCSELIFLVVSLIPTSSCVESLFSFYRYANKINMKVKTADIRLSAKFIKMTQSRLSLM